MKNDNDKRVILITPSPYDFATNPDARRVVSPPSMPLGIMVLGSFLQQNGVPVELIDAQMDFGFGLTEAAEYKIVERIVTYLYQESGNIAWIGISCLAHPYALNGLLLGRGIKAALPGIPLIFGGYFASTHYRFLLNNHHFIDGIVYGDGEVPALEISQRLGRGCSLATPDLPNWIYRDAQGDLIKSDCSHPLNLDALPILDFTLLKHYDEYPIASMLTSRGCPFHCHYCVEHSMRPYRPISLVKLSQELRHANTILPCEHMFIVDPTFGLGQRRLRSLIQLFQQTKFAFILESRADTLDSTQIASLWEAHTECLSLGIESASLSTLLRMGKIRSPSQYEDYLNGARRIAAECFRHNITLCIGIMLGYPGDTHEDTKVSLDFVADLAELHRKVHHETGHAPGFLVFPNYTRIYPGSRLAEAMKDYPEAVFRAESLDGEYSVVAPSPGYTFDELEKHFVAFEQASVLTPIAEERVIRYIAFSLESILANHPDLVQDGIVCLRGAVQKLGEDKEFLRYSPFCDDRCDEAGQEAFKHL